MDRWRCTLLLIQSRIERRQIQSRARSAFELPQPTVLVAFPTARHCRDPDLTRIFTVVVVEM